MGEDEIDKGWARMNPRSSCAQKTPFGHASTNLYCHISSDWLLKTMPDLFK